MLGAKCAGRDDSVWKKEADEETRSFVKSSVGMNGGSLCSTQILHNLLLLQ